MYKNRLIDRELAEAFSTLPAVSLVGPRACGKTTTATNLVPNVVNLAEPANAKLFRDDPDAALRAVGEPVLLDEWQETPAVLGAVKRAVDNGTGPGRFLLTGSARVDLDVALWPGTGRVVEVAMSTMTVRERLGHLAGRLFVDRLLDERPLSSLTPATSWADAPTVTDYLNLAREGGFPEPLLTLDQPGRDRWTRGYIDLLITRDSHLTGTAPDPGRLGRFLEVVSLNTAGVINDQTLAEVSGVSLPTVRAYENVLRRVYAVSQLPAWWSNRLTRLTKQPKWHLSDSCLMPAATRVDFSTILRDGNLYGRMLETFVIAQINAELPLSKAAPRLYHLRDQGGRREIDLVVEYSLGRIAAVEVKSASVVDDADARHLAWLKERLGDRFLCGVVLYSGPATIELADGIIAAPISTLWA